MEAFTNSFYQEDCCHKIFPNGKHDTAKKLVLLNRFDEFGQRVFDRQSTTNISQTNN